MLGSLISVETQAELLDTAQPLKFRSVNQPDHQSSFSRFVGQRNNVVNRISVNALGHD